MGKTESRLEGLLERGEFVVTAELGPPKSAERRPVEKKAAMLIGHVDGINITDNQTAIVRLSSIAASKIVLDMGGEPVVQMTCRDRNRIAIQSDILGAYALGIRNILCLTGDHQSLGNHPDARGVFDIDSIQLIQMVRLMREHKVFFCGEEIRNTKKGPTGEPRMFIGGVENPFAEPFIFRVARLAKKIRAGADFIQTQPVYDFERFKRWMGMVRDQGLDQQVALIAGVMPVKSHRALIYMNENVAGIKIPRELIARMEHAVDPKEEGITIAVEQVEQLREIPGIRGVHLMTVEWEDAIPEVVERAGLLPRPAIGTPSAETSLQAGGGT
jgi:methylenetetrahydrofolate reductase (NADPH)